MRLLCFLLALCFAVALLAQKDGENTKVVLFKEHTQSQWDTVPVMKTCIKLNPLLFFHGEIPVYVERAVSEKLSIEAGIGFTTRNYVSLTFNDENDDFGAGTEIQPKLAAHVALRYYFTDDLEPYGFYISPEFATRAYTKIITERDDSGALTDRRRNDERVFNDTKLLLGYQILSGTNNWLFDLYGGFGLRNRDHKKVIENFDPGDTTANPPIPPSRVYTDEFVDDTIFAFFLGFKFGIGF